MSYKYKRPSYSFESNNDLANEVLAKAGPNNIYYRPGYSTEYSNRTTYTTEISHEPTTYSNVQYKINDDPDPVRIVRQTEPVTQRQNIRIRYLDPPTPPTPAPIVIRERQLTPPPPAPPIYIRQQARAPPTPPPLFIRFIPFLSHQSMIKVYLTFKITERDHQLHQECQIQLLLRRLFQLQVHRQDKS